MGGEADDNTCAACTQEVVRISVVLQLRHALLLLGHGVSALEVLSEVPHTLHLQLHSDLIVYCCCGVRVIRSLVWSVA